MIEIISDQDTINEEEKTDHVSTLNSYKSTLEDIKRELISFIEKGNYNEVLLENHVNTVNEISEYITDLHNRSQPNYPGEMKNH